MDGIGRIRGGIRTLGTVVFTAVALSSAALLIPSVIESGNAQTGDGFDLSWSTIDASIRLSSPNNFWQVALIGRNLTNRLYVIGASDAGTVTPGVQGDAFGFTNRSRQVMIQVTARPM